MLANLVNTFDLDFILPLTLVDENMKRAYQKDALTRGKFWWKCPKGEIANITRMNDLEETNFTKSNSKNFGRPAEENYEGTWQPHAHHHNHDACTEEQKEEAKLLKEISIAQILEGDSAIGIPKGLITMMEEYMEIQDWEEEQIEVVMKML